MSLCGSNYDTKVAIYATANCPVNPNTAVSCSDDDCALQSELVANVVSGATYLIRVGGFGANWGTGTLRVSPGFPNDECAYAIPVTNGSTNFVTNCAGTDGPLENFNAGLQQITGDLWYRYTATICGNIAVNTCGSGFDTKLAIYTGTDCPLANGTALQTSDDICGQNASTTFFATGDSTYLIRVGGHNGAYGSGTLTITPSGSSPANDDCANATSINDGTVTFNTSYACTDGPYDSVTAACNPKKDIWYSYTSPYCGSISVDLCGSSFDTKVAVYHGTCGNLGDPIACNDDACGTRSQLSFYTTDMGPYLIRVGGYNGAYGAGAMTVTHNFLAYTNDNCGGAYTVGYGVDTLITYCAGSSSDTSSCGTFYSDLWFSFFPPANTTNTVSLCGSSINTRLAVYYSLLGDCSTKAS